MEPKIVELVQKEGRKVTFRPGEMIFCQGEKDNCFYYMQDGLALIYALSDDGRERSILIAWPGRFFGMSNFLANEIHLSSAIATKHCDVIEIDRPAFERCRQQAPELLEILVSALSLDVGTLFQEIIDSSLFSADVKVARFICRRVGEGRYVMKDGKMLLDYTQDFIASITGVSRWATNQSLAALRDRGWLTTSYGTILISDFDAIRRFGYGD